MVTPAVLIATHKRLSITTDNINSLLAQSVVPQIILVVSDDEEIKYYRRAFPQIIVYFHPNEPLGAKWQTGVCALANDSVHYSCNADLLIVTGSDDILGPGFIENACRLVEAGNHFVGLQRWWIHHKGKAYLCDYMALQPLGGGRIYSKQMLEKLQYKLFDISLDRHLDDYVWDKVRAGNLKVKWVRDVEKEGLLIHAIKGDWPVMNRFDLKHKNIKLIRTDESKRVLPGLFS